MSKNRYQNRSWYEVHRLYDNGEVEWNGYLDPSGYSKYYENKLCYNLEDAQNHTKEAEERTGYKYVVIHCKQNKHVI